MLFSEKELGSTILFYGCRRRDEDYLYQEELEGYEREQVLAGLHVAFSRDHQEKVYVQHMLKNAGEKIYQLLEKQAYFYVCGCVERVVEKVACGGS